MSPEVYRALDGHLTRALEQQMLAILNQPSQQGQPSQPGRQQGTRFDREAGRRA